MKNQWVALSFVLLFAGVERVEAMRAPHTVAIAPVSTSTTAPDGSYRCHKISGDQLMDIGDLEISGGQATLIGLPKGWVIKEVAVRDTNDRGQIIVAVDYRSTSGFNDRLDCLPK